MLKKTNTERLFAHLHRGGNYAHLWTDAGNCSHWFATQNGRATREQRTIPKAWLRSNVYFTVHPLSQIPPSNASGNTDPRYIGSQLPYISAINALFAEYDGKDYVDHTEFEGHLPSDFQTQKQVHQKQAIKAAKETVFYLKPQTYKARAWGEISVLYYTPSIIVDSGGGYHCYWLLRHTIPVDDANRADIQAVQHSWVQMVGGDVGASDLRRILRVPGTYNMKEGFGAEHPQVAIVKADFDLLFDYDGLEEAVNDWLHDHQPEVTSTQPRRRRPFRQEDGLRAQFNDRFSLVDMLTRHGYQICGQTDALTRLARPGRGRARTSVTVFRSRMGGVPDLSVHFSTNDELYSEEYQDPETGQVKRQAHDAYHAFVMLEHDGDWHAAYMDAIQKLRPQQMTFEI